jgi:hypothetical protein
MHDAFRPPRRTYVCVPSLLSLPYRTPTSHHPTMHPCNTPAQHPPPSRIALARCSLSRHVKQPQGKQRLGRRERTCVIRPRITPVPRPSPVRRMVRWWVLSRGHEMWHVRWPAPISPDQAPLSTLTGRSRVQHGQPWLMCMLSHGVTECMSVSAYELFVLHAFGWLCHAVVHMHP